VRVREPIWDPGGEAVAVDEPVDGLGRQRLGLLAAVAAEPHEERVLVAQGPLGERVDPGPCIDRVLHEVGDRHLAFAAALAVHVEPVVAGVRSRAPQILSAESAQLGRAQPAVAQDAQYRDMLRATCRGLCGAPNYVAVVDREGPSGEIALVWAT
jgi:hypothetical protein